MEDKNLRELHEAFAEFKKANDALLAEFKATGNINGELKAKVEQLSAVMDQKEDAINKRLSEIEAKATANAALEQKIADLEALLHRKGVNPDFPSVDEMKEKARFARASFFKALRSATDHRAIKTAGVLSPDELKALIVSNDKTGGYLAPAEYVAEMLMNVVEFSNIRSIARIRTTSAGSIQMPKRTQAASATWTAEKVTRAETTNPNWGLEEIKTHELHALAKVSHADLEDSAFDLDAFLRDEFAEQFGVAEGTACVSGNGIAKPEGFMTNADVASVNSGDADQITGDGLIAVYYELKEAYLNNATWVMNRSTLKAVRQLKEGVTGQYLWAPGIKADARPATILDRPYVTCPDMDSEGSNKYPVAVGDFRRAFVIVDRLSLEVMVDPFTSKSTGMVEFSARRRVGAQTIIPEAIKKLKCST